MGHLRQVAHAAVPDPQLLTHGGPPHRRGTRWQDSSPSQAAAPQSCRESELCLGGREPGTPRFPGASGQHPPAGGIQREGDSRQDPEHADGGSPPGPAAGTLQEVV